MLYGQVLGEETEVAAAKDLCDLSDGGVAIFLSEIGMDQMESACVEDSHTCKHCCVVVPVACAFVVVELGLALLVGCVLESLINLAFVSDVKPFVELFHGFSGVFEGGEVIVARGLCDDCPGIRW